MSNIVSSDQLQLLNCLCQAQNGIHSRANRIEEVEGVRNLFCTLGEEGNTVKLTADTSTIDNCVCRVRNGDNSVPYTINRTYAK